VVAKIEWHAGELFPRIGLIVTNLRWKHSNVVKFHNRRGTAEQWIEVCDISDGRGAGFRRSLNVSID
jgi:hypothetical protein